MQYTLMDFRHLVSRWYNEFLPDRVSDKAVFVESAGIVYLNGVSIEPFRKESIRFFLDCIGETIGSETSAIVVMESKPVNNPRLHGLMKLLEKSNSIDDKHREFLLHLANRRYLVRSSDVLISQDKDIDEFLSTIFSVLVKLNPPNIGFYSSGTYGFPDICQTIRSFLPKNLLNIQETQNAGNILVDSTNDILSEISLKLVKETQLDSSTSRFLNRSLDSLKQDIEKLI